MIMEMLVKMHKDHYNSTENHRETGGGSGGTVATSVFLRRGREPAYDQNGGAAPHCPAGAHPVHPAAGEGNNLNHQIRRSVAATVIQLGLVADDGDIRLNPVFVLCVRIDGKGSWIDLACAVMIVDILPQNKRELGDEFLMHPARWHYIIIKLAANQFRPVSFWESPIVFRCIACFFW